MKPGTVALRAAAPEGGRRSRRFPQGRVCAHPGCSTVLSVYNPRPHCFMHADIPVPRLRGKVSSN